MAQDAESAGSSAEKNSAGSAGISSELVSNPSATNSGDVRENGGEEKPETIVDVVHAEISRTIQETATWMDSFFGDWRHASELNESYIRFRYNYFMEEHTRPVRNPDFQMRLLLPQLRQKTRIVFAGSPKESSDFSAVGSPTQRDYISRRDEKNVTAAVDQTLLDSAKQNFSLRSGAKLSKLRPVFMLGPRYRVLLPIDPWALRYTQEVIWTSNKGYETRSTADAERIIDNDLFFRASNEVVWREGENGVIYAVLLTVGQPLSKDSGIDYEWVNLFRTRPVHILTEVTLRVRYRQRILRDWLFLELAPQYRYPRDRSFKATPGILFQVDAIFGKYQTF